MSRVYRQRGKINANGAYTGDPVGLKIPGPIRWARILRCLSGPQTNGHGSPGYGAQWAINDGVPVQLDGREVLWPDRPNEIERLELFGACLDVEVETFPGRYQYPGPVATDRRGAWVPLIGGIMAAGGTPNTFPSPDAPESIGGGGVWTHDFDELLLSVANTTDVALDCNVNTLALPVLYPTSGLIPQGNTFTSGTVGASSSPGRDVRAAQLYMGRTCPNDEVTDINTSLFSAVPPGVAVAITPESGPSTGFFSWQLYGRRR